MYYFKNKQDRKRFENEQFAKRGWKYGKTKIINGEIYIEIIEKLSK